jgi:hypothetical protein
MRRFISSHRERFGRIAAHRSSTPSSFGPVLVLALVFPLALAAQSTSGAQPVKVPEKPPVGPEAQVVIEVVKQEGGKIQNPLAALFRIVVEKETAWAKVEKAALDQVTQTARENPCTKRIVAILGPAKEAFATYVKANELYIQKWGELTADAVGVLDNSGVEVTDGEDLTAEKRRINEEIAKLKDQMSQFPADDPIFDDARKENARLLQMLTENLSAVERAETEGRKGAHARIAQKQLLDARLKQIEAMKDNLKIRRDETAKRYDAIVTVWAAKCLAATSEMGQ